MFNCIRGQRALLRAARIVLLSLVLMASAPAWAKKVSLEWKEIRGAKQYELQIERNEKVVLSKKIEEISWKGNLEFGVYTYQIRGLDRANRPGRWSQARPLVVMPAAPPPQAPLDDATVTLYRPRAPVVLKWFEVQGVSRYVVEVRRGKKVIYHETIKGSETALKTLAPGDYTWQVTPVVEAAGRVPASMEGRTWEGTPGKPLDFTVVRGQLDKPAPVAPLGLLPPAKKKVALEWKKVTGAELYEVEFIPDPTNKKGRNLSSSESWKLKTAENTVSIDPPGEGNYTWKVRALANIDPANQDSAAVGPESVAAFQVDPNAKFFEGAGYVAISAMFAPYDYRGTSPENGTESKASSQALTGRVSGEYYFHPLWGAGLGVERTQFSFGSEVLWRNSLEATLKFRMTLSEGEYGWSLSPKIGLEMRDYFMLIQSAGATATAARSVSVSANASNAKGVQAGFDLRKQFSRKFSLGVKFAYFRPLMISGAGVGTLTPDASNRNLSVGAQALYWLGPRWGVGLGAYLDNRSISYTSTKAGTSATAQPEQISMDGKYFFGSLIYSWR